LAQGTTAQILVGGGAALPVWTTATGTGSPVRATSPSLSTPSLGAATAISINGATITSGTLAGSVSGTNTGDNAVNSLYSGLAASKQDTLVSGVNIKTVNAQTLVGSGNINIEALNEATYYTVLPSGSLTRPLGIVAGSIWCDANYDLWWYNGTTDTQLN